MRSTRLGRAALALWVLAAGALAIGVASALLVGRLLTSEHACLAPDRCDGPTNRATFSVVVIVGSGVLFALLSLVDMLRSGRLDEEFNRVVARRGIRALTAITAIPVLGYLVLQAFDQTVRSDQPLAFAVLGVLALLPALIGIGRPLLLSATAVALTVAAIFLAYYLVLPAPALFAYAAVLMAVTGRAVHAARV